MSTVPISMRKLKEILRLKFDAKLPHRRIAQSLSISASTVSYYVNRAGQLGITWPIPSDLNDRDLEHAFQSTQVKIKQPRYPVPDWVEIKNQLTNKTITLQFLWDEYASKSTYHYSYPQFCRLYKQWLKKQKLSMRQHHIAGEKLFVDYCGPTVNIVDPTTHEIIKAQIFVAVMGASSYTYAEATHSQNLENWIMSHVRCFEFLGGVPSIIIPDNLKSAVTKASRYEPDLNPTYQQLAAYYGTTVLPTRPYKPKDKAKVEVAVQVVERWIIARLRHETFYSLAQLNASIRALIDELNARQLQKRTDSRRSLFQSIDLPALQALPARPYVFTQVKKTRVPSDYHIEVEQYFYSVPYQLAKELVEVYISGQLVEIYHHGTLAARHPRQHQAGLHTTQLAHCPLVHKAQLQESNEAFLAWSKNVGKETQEVIELYFQEDKPRGQKIKLCRGLQHLARRYGGERLNAACNRGLQTGAISFKALESILKKGLENISLPMDEEHTAFVSTHKNLRGKSYYC